jgi:regulator of nucleoside diphosphate kinase
MSKDACILTTKDLTVLEIMLERCLGTGGLLRPLLRRKIEAATVVFREDVAPNVATIGVASSVALAAANREPLCFPTARRRERLASFCQSTIRTDLLCLV